MKNILRSHLIIIFSVISVLSSNAQKINNSIGAKIHDGSIMGGKIEAKQDGSIKFAIISDVHISIGAPSVEGTSKCVRDINKNDDIQFVIISGDIANFGSDDELALSKNIFDSLNKPWFIIAGNHDATWSESGTNSFLKTFGYERFEFEAGGIKFIGNPCGPNIKMAPALVPRESFVWLEDVIRQTPKEQPIFYVNHYPLDTSLLKYNEVIDLLKTKNIQLVISGHWHQNVPMEYEGIPGVIVRSALKDSKREPGYIIAEVRGSLISFSEKIAGSAAPKSPWYRVRMSKGEAYNDGVEYPRRTNSFNDEYPNVTQVWRYQNNADIGSGAAVYTENSKDLLSNGERNIAIAGSNFIPYLAREVAIGDIVIFADEAGVIHALNALNGSELWVFKSDGKIFSTPAVSGKYVVVGSSDNYIYCLNAKSGKLLWKYRCNKSVLGSANIYKGKLFIGASDNTFRALRLKDGKLLWQFDKMNGFVVSRPYVDDYQVVIGDWGNTLYSFDPNSGKLQWEWKTPRKVTNFSPAQVWPVKSNGRILIATPDRFSYQIDAKTGKNVSRNYGGREAIGLSPNGDGYYVKSMKDTVKFISSKEFAQYPSSTASSDPNERESKVIWTSIPGYNYEIGPTPITSVQGVGKESKGILFIATDKGNIFALNCLDGSIVFKHNISGALINYIMPIGKSQLLVSTMDGVVSLLSYTE